MNRTILFALACTPLALAAGTATKPAKPAAAKTETISVKPPLPASAQATWLHQVTSCKDLVIKADATKLTSKAGKKVLAIGDIKLVKDADGAGAYRVTPTDAGTMLIARARDAFVWIQALSKVPESAWVTNWRAFLASHSAASVIALVAARDQFINNAIIGEAFNPQKIFADLQTQINKQPAIVKTVFADAQQKELKMATVDYSFDNATITKSAMPLQDMLEAISKANKK